MKHLWRTLRTLLPWLVCGVLASAVTLLTLAPVAWFSPEVARATHGRARLIDGAGSLWRGSATLALTPGADPQGATVLPGRLEWHTAFWPLFAGRLLVHIRQTEAMPDAVVLDAGLRGGTVSAGNARLPASLLAGLGAPFNTLDLQAEVHATWSEWRWFGQRVGAVAATPGGAAGGAYGRLDLDLRDAVSRVSTVRPLGSYHVAVQAEGANATLTLDTVKGPLLLDGHGDFGAAGVRFSGRANAAPEQRDNLAGLLNLLGDPAGGGAVKLRFGSGML